MGNRSKKTKRSLGRRLIRLVVLSGIGALVWQKVRDARTPAAEPYLPRTPVPAPTPTPTASNPTQAVIPQSPVEPPAPAAPVAPDPEPEAIEQFETEAPLPPEGSLTSFFDDVMAEPKQDLDRH